MSTAAPARTEGTFRAPDFVLQAGGRLPDCELAFATYGELSPARDNVVVFTTKFAATHEDNEFLIGPGRVLDTDRYFVVCVNLLGAGRSTSPSTTTAVPPGAFPLVTIYDNVRLQRAMLEERFDVQAVELVLGASMGGLQAYHWAVMHADLVRRAAVICGAARIAPHNSIFLDGMRAVLQADAAYNGGDYGDRPPVRGLRAMGAAWAPWALSQPFYRDELYRSLGAPSARAFVATFFEQRFEERDANDLLAQMASWQAADVGALEDFGGDTEAALASITAEVLLMPGATDQYFRADDSAREVVHLQHGELRPIPSDWGHWAGNHVDPVAVAFMSEHLGALLAREPRPPGPRRGAGR
jgi:homoserine O-acetyltransferase